eukprot:CAMPEP_0184424364 /NCGR_PEP_ID=MMETSP0738-20130409/108052_1 /TAXON_ID=385413 /ORGANISM="Thalassiosira miniscula, Strain CCMP1093" /LENGTH=58 /DNA_ID=CAMNT_0026786781 /DNA_START=1 /DNA_END=177 /DNA_ORIENTATION=-
MSYFRRLKIEQNALLAKGKNHPAIRAKMPELIDKEIKLIRTVKFRVESRFAKSEVSFV